MSTPQPSPPAEVVALAKEVPPAGAGVDSLDVKASEGFSEKLVDAIEMLGEETAAGWRPAPSPITPGMRYLHCSRTIHQLVTDRNRAVGIYLAVASLFLTASSAIFHAKPEGNLIVPLHEIQRWCLPITFGTLALLALFVAFLLIRTRVGLIYEVAKMNALLGLPLGRVKRISLLSIFFIMHVLISLAGGGSAALFTVFMVHLADPTANYAALVGITIGLALTLFLIVLYIVTVCYTTSDKRLQQANQ